MPPPPKKKSLGNALSWRCEPCLSLGSKSHWVLDRCKGWENLSGPLQSPQVDESVMGFPSWRWSLFIGSTSPSPQGPGVAFPSPEVIPGSVGRASWNPFIFRFVCEVGRALICVGPGRTFTFNFQK